MSVYFIRDGDRIKIGYSANPVQRAKALPGQLVTFTDGDRLTESLLHAEFAHLRIEGEWFRAEEPLLGLVGQVATPGFLDGFLAPRVERMRVALDQTLAAAGALVEHDRQRRQIVLDRAAAIREARADRYKLREIAEALGVTIERVRQMGAEV